MTGRLGARQMQGGQRPGRRSPTSSPRGHHGRRARGIAGGTTPEDLGFLANAGLGGRSLFQVQMDGRNNAPFPQPGETNMLAPLLPLLDQLLFNMDRSVTQQPSQQQQHTNGRSDSLLTLYTNASYCRLYSHLSIFDRHSHQQCTIGFA